MRKKITKKSLMEVKRKEKDKKIDKVVLIKGR